MNNKKKILIGVAAVAAIGSAYYFMFKKKTASDKAKSTLVSKVKTNLGGSLESLAVKDMTLDTAMLKKFNSSTVPGKV